MNSGVKIPATSRLIDLRPVLSKWVALNKRLGKEWQFLDDAPWWHIERALVSLFAGAVWRCKGDAFEEFAEEKRGKRLRKGGRIDLWFSFADINNKAEAKQCWVPSHNIKKAFVQVSKVMDTAVRDAKSLHPDGMRRLAIVFGAVRIPKCSKQRLLTRIKDSISFARNDIAADATAWVFADGYKPPIAGRYTYPGIIIWVKEVQQPNSRKGTTWSNPAKFTWKDSDIEFVAD